MRSFLASFFSFRNSFLLLTFSSLSVFACSLGCARISTMINLVRAAYNNCMKFNRILSFAASMGCCLIAAPVSMSPEPPLYQMIRGQYEDKIRRYSPPQKIFNVFALKNENQQYVLSLQALLQAICFYNYSEYTDENLQNFNPQYIKQLLGKQKDFEIYDYFTFVRFLTFDGRKLQAFMHEKSLSLIDKSAFKDLMLNQVCADYDTHIRQNIGIESRQYRPSKQGFLKKIITTGDSMFQKKESYTLTELIDFRQQLMKQLYAYEFKCYKSDQNAIDGVDFARSIVKYAQNNQKRKFLRRVKTIQQGIESIKVKQKQYVDFHFGLQLNLKLMEQTLQAEGAIGRNEIGTLLGGSHISDGQVEVLFRLLDTDDSGFIEKREVLGVIESLGYYWNVKSGQQTLQQLLETRWNNLCDKAKKISQILLEE